MGGVVVLSVGHQTCEYRMRVRVLPGQHCAVALGKLHLCASVTKQYNLVPVKRQWCSEAGKVTIGLATHWPCVTDFMIYPPTGSREMSTPPQLTIRHGLPLPIYTGGKRWKHQHKTEEICALCVWAMKTWLELPPAFHPGPDHHCRVFQMVA